MENPLNILLKNIINYFVNSPEDDELENYRKISTLIRIHSEKLAQCGDASFPGKPEIWLNYFPKPKRQLNEAAFQITSEEELTNVDKSNFLQKARHWPFPVEKLVVRQERIHLHLNRSVILANLLPQVLKSDNYGCLKKSANKKVYLNPLPENSSEEDLSFYRNKLLYSVLRKVLKYSRWNEVGNKNFVDSSSFLELQVQSVASKIEQNCSEVILKCGLVTDPSNGRRCQLPTKDYLRYKFCMFLSTVLFL